MYLDEASAFQLCQSHFQRLSLFHLVTQLDATHTHTHTHTHTQREREREREISRQNRERKCADWRISVEWAKFSFRFGGLIRSPISCPLSLVLE